MSCSLVLFRFFLPRFHGFNVRFILSLKEEGSLSLVLLFLTHVLLPNLLPLLLLWLQKLLHTDLERLRKDFKRICREMSYEGKLFGVETTEDLEGNNIWNRLHVETKNQLLQRLALNDGDYLWLAIGEDDTKTVMTV